MTTFNEADHPRHVTGQFAEKQQTAPVGTLTQKRPDEVWADVHATIVQRADEIAPHHFDEWVGLSYEQKEEVYIRTFGRSAGALIEEIADGFWDHVIGDKLAGEGEFVHRKYKSEELGPSPHEALENMHALVLDRANRVAASEFPEWANMSAEARDELLARTFGSDTNEIEDDIAAGAWDEALRERLDYGLEELDD
jgi:hypothetical protein